MANNLSINLSPRLKALFDKRALNKTFKSIFKQAAKFTLGRHSQNRNSRSAPLRKGFGPWGGGGNARTKNYAEYSEKYEQFKDEQGFNNWHFNSGDLFHDAIKMAGIEPENNGFTITVNPGKSKKYAKAQQDGTKNIPPRPYYEIDESDEKALAIFIENRLVQAFGTEAGISQSRG